MTSAAQKTNQSVSSSVAHLSINSGQAAKPGGSNVTLFRDYLIIRLMYYRQDKVTAGAKI